MAAEAGLCSLTTPLRVFDVVVWYAYNPNPQVKHRAMGLADKAGNAMALALATL
ncbi:hypothetical protein GCM10027063_13800 [Promicromonospora xylanilytica]